MIGSVNLFTTGSEPEDLSAVYLGAQTDTAFVSVLN